MLMRCQPDQRLVSAAFCIQSDWKWFRRFAGLAELISGRAHLLLDSIPEGFGAGVVRLRFVLTSLFEGVLLRLFDDLNILGIIGSQRPLFRRGRRGVGRLGG